MTDDSNIIDPSHKLEWLPVPVKDGCLRMQYCREYSHVLSFRIFGEQLDPEGGDDWEIEAGVKWDGCINWSTNPHCAYHFCGYEDAERLSRTFAYAWQFTSENLDTWRDVGQIIGALK